MNPSKDDAEDVAEDADEDEEEEYEDTDEELNAAQNYSKQGVVDIIDNFMHGNDAFARLAPEFPEPDQNLTKKSVRKVTNKKVTNRKVTENPVRDAQKKRLAERH